MKALTVLKYVGFGILGVGFVIGVIFGVQALWNWLIPELFHGPVLTFWRTAMGKKTGEKNTIANSDQTAGRKRKLLLLSRYKQRTAFYHSPQIYRVYF
jgi:hypothetical protein